MKRVKVMEEEVTATELGGCGGRGESPKER